ncbi:MAG: hypothetical protein M1834_003150 [Cirrosporium novae-zelandiae]|nr:MAG: hypothetical protein M1834_003150 [Cirrosporium novae-zelandiae]
MGTLSPLGRFIFARSRLIKLKWQSSNGRAGEDIDLDLSPLALTSSEPSNPVRKLLIISYSSYWIPLIPYPDLDFDVHDLPTPPDACEDFEMVMSKFREASKDDDSIRHFERDMGYALSDGDEGGPRSGRSSAFQRELFSHKKTRDRFEEVLRDVQSRMEEGKYRDKDSYADLIIGVSCKFGWFRSVAFAEELRRKINRARWDVEVRHRELTWLRKIRASDKENNRASKDPPGKRSDGEITMESRGRTQYRE